ncbi:hypothetical protein F5D26_30980 [Burkholderia pseudomallei]|nr:hypothetical protein F5D26_30980 [Burkholderia pseudomallei]TPB57185.1 hypothetical protein DIJ63_32265 [Burkholderia pseudomallei]
MRGRAGLRPLRSEEDPMLPHARFADAADCPRASRAPPRCRDAGSWCMAHRRRRASPPSRLHRAFTDTNLRSLPR